MQTRPFGRTGRRVSEIGFGAWAIGGSWGAVDESDAVAALNAALDSGVTFIDTADVYGDGRSERLIRQVLKERGGERPFVATKAGRRLPQQTVAGYTDENLHAWIERSLTNLAVETLDLVQLHCPPTDLYYHPEAFDSLDRLKKNGKIRDYGVSVERIEEAIKAIEYPGVVSVQIIFNTFRQRPADLFFDLAKKKRARRHRARAAGEWPAHRQVSRQLELRGRRPPEVQPPRRGLRRRRDILRRAVRRRPRGGRSRPEADRRRRRHGAIRAALDPDVRRGDGRDPGGQEFGAGSSQCAGRRSAGPAPVGHGRAQGDLRPGHQAARPSAVVTPPSSSFVGRGEIPFACRGAGRQSRAPCHRGAGDAVRGKARPR